MSPKIIVTAVLLLLLAGGGSAIYMATQQTQKALEAETQTVSPEDEANPKVVGENVTFTITEGEVKRWEIKVKKAFYFPDHSGADLLDVYGHLFDDDGEITATFTAPKGVFDQKSQGIDLSGGVVVNGGGDEPATLKAPHLTWSPKKEKISADGGVELTRQGFGVSRADRCQFSMDFDFVALEGNAQTELDY